MKKKTILQRISFLGFALPAGMLVLAGCEESTWEHTQNETSQMFQGAEDSLENAGDSFADAMNEAWNGLGEITYESRDEVADFFDGTGEYLDEQFSEFEDEMSGLSQNAREGYENALAEAREARENFEDQIDELGDASESSWNNAWSEVETAWNNLQNEIQEVEDRA